jgi:hypothetical protein
LTPINQKEESPMKHLHAIVLALAVATLLTPSARAADTQPARGAQPAPAAAAAPANRLEKARELIAERQWSAALGELRRVDDTGSADWNNLMGFVLRKGNTPDLAASERYYDAALRIDPHHLNTLEYSGELYLMKGELDKAQGRLATLESLCSAGCSQSADLSAAIGRYKAAGNKYVATSW